MHKFLESYRVIHQMKDKTIFYQIMMPILSFEKNQILGLPPYLGPERADFLFERAEF